MGTGTCAVLWQTKRNVVSAQREDGKEGRGDLPFSSLSLESTDSGAVRPWSRLGFVSMGWQEKAASSPSQHQQNMFPTCVGRAGAGKASGAARVGYRESGSLSTFAQPAHFYRGESRKGKWGQKCSASDQNLEENLANSKKWPRAQGQAAFLQRSSAFFRPLTCSSSDPHVATPLWIAREFLQ